MKFVAISLFLSYISIVTMCFKQEGEKERKKKEEWIKFDLKLKLKLHGISREETFFTNTTFFYTQAQVGCMYRQVQYSIVNCTISIEIIN